MGKNIKTIAQGYSEMAQLVKVFAAKSEFHLGDPRGGRREPISGSCGLTNTQFNLGSLFVFGFVFCCWFLVGWFGFLSFEVVVHLKTSRLKYGKTDL